MKQRKSIEGMDSDPTLQTNLQENHQMAKK